MKYISTKPSQESAAFSLVSRDENAYNWNFEDTLNSAFDFEGDDSAAVELKLEGSIFRLATAHVPVAWPELAQA